MNNFVSNIVHVDHVLHEHFSDGLLCFGGCVTITIMIQTIVLSLRLCSDILHNPKLLAILDHETLDV